MTRFRKSARVVGRTVNAEQFCKTLLRALLLALSLLSAAACAPSGRVPEETPPAPSPTTYQSATSTTRATSTATPSPSATATATPSPSATATATPSSSATATATLSPSVAPTSTPPGEGAVPVYSYNVVGVFPHDPDAWTQGLVVENGKLLEGTGRHGQSSLRSVDLETGEVLQFLALPAQYYGEGITSLDGRIIQLTWRSQVGFVYDTETFELLDTFRYTTEGWGLTHDGTRLIMSDGTSTLRFLDPETFEETGKIDVHNRYGPIPQLNELEYVEGEVWANVWYTDVIARIDPSSGRVVGWIDLQGLLDPQDRESSADILNGIAYDAEAGRLFVTGKLWPKLFEIELVPRQGS
jgi:glutamine cyclotransferase